MSNNLKFVIFTSFSSKLGYGHFNRCKILADALIKKGNNVEIKLLNKTKTIQFKENWIKYFFKKTKYPKAYVSIVDNYIYNDKFYLILRKYYENIVIFDDFTFKVPNHVIGVINPNIYANKKNYPSNIKAWAGKKYILLRKEFKKKLKRQNKKNIFLCLGGSDPTLQMNKYINILLKNTNLKINAIFGPGYKNLQDLNKWKKNKRVNVFYNTKKMSNIMSSSKFALSSSGNILYELKSLDIPTICVSLAKNQKLLGQSMSKFDNIDYLGHYKQLKKSKLIKAIKKKENQIFKTNKNNFYLNGSDELAKELTNFFRIKKNNSTYFNSSDIKNEYDESANEIKEHDKLRWGTKKSMINRYNFLIKKVFSKKIKNWLDIGSGTGELQIKINSKYPNIGSTGLEISRKLYLISKKKTQNKLIKFYNIDFLKYKKKKSYFDLISCVGVLSKTNFSLNQFLKKSYSHLKKNGILFFDFKNKDWKKFNNSFFPDVRHKWYKIKEVKNEVLRNKNFKILQFIGFEPISNKEVHCEDSHSNYLIIKKIK